MRRSIFFERIRKSREVISFLNNLPAPRTTVEEYRNYFFTHFSSPEDFDGLESPSRFQETLQDSIREFRAAVTSQSLQLRQEELLRSQSRSALVSADEGNADEDHLLPYWQASVDKLCTTTENILRDFLENGVGKELQYEDPEVLLALSERFIQEWDHRIRSEIDDRLRRGFADIRQVLRLRDRPLLANPDLDDFNDSVRLFVDGATEEINRQFEPERLRRNNPFHPNDDIASLADDEVLRLGGDSAGTVRRREKLKSDIEESDDDDLWKHEYIIAKASRRGPARSI